jgi:hypothetical protein
MDDNYVLDLDGNFVYDVFFDGYGADATPIKIILNGDITIRLTTTLNPGPNAIETASDLTFRIRDLELVEDLGTLGAYKNLLPWVNEIMFDNISGNNWELVHREPINW